MNIAEQFEKNRYVYIENVISRDACEALTQHMFELKKADKLHKDDQCPLSLSAYGDPTFDSILEKLSGFLSEKLNIELLPTYSYARIYSPGEKLERHTDRESCEISGTVTLGFDPDSDIWPISFSVNKDDLIGNSSTIDIGDMVVYRGNEVYHWRDEYKGKWQVQVFFHFVNAKGPHAEWKNDKRSKINLDNLGVYHPSFLSNADGIAPCLATFNREFKPEFSFTKDECEKIISYAQYIKPTRALIGNNEINENIRKANVYDLNLNAKTSWVYDKIFGAVGDANKEFFKFEIFGMTHGLQLINYKSTNKGFYDWHVDMGPGVSSTRKISVVVMLSESSDYENGDLILDNYGREVKAGREIGSVHLFPSYLRHTVTPVTSGERWVLVNWIHGHKRFS